MGLQKLLQETEILALKEKIKEQQQEIARLRGELNKSARTTLVEIYKDRRNTYLTIERFAEHNGITATQAGRLIDLSGQVSKSNHPEAF